MEDVWLQRVRFAAARYHSTRTGEDAEGALNEYARVLQIYADRVLRGVKPND